MRTTNFPVARVVLSSVVCCVFLGSLAAAAEFAPSEVRYWQREDGQTFPARLVDFQRGIATFDGQEGVVQLHINDLHDYSVRALQDHLRGVRAPAEEAEAERRRERAQRRQEERRQNEYRQRQLRDQAAAQVAMTRETMGYNNLFRAAEANNALAWWALVRRSYRYPAGRYIFDHHDHHHHTDPPAVDE